MEKGNYRFFSSRCKLQSCQHKQGVATISHKSLKEATSPVGLHNAHFLLFLACPSQGHRNRIQVFSSWIFDKSQTKCTQGKSCCRQTTKGYLLLNSLHIDKNEVYQMIPTLLLPSIFLVLLG